MPPHSEHPTSTVVQEPAECAKQEISPSKTKFKPQIVWKNVIIFIYLHIAALYGFKLFLFDAMWTSWVWCWILYLLGGMGVTAGAHRMWCHRSYKGTLSLRIYLCLCNCIGFQVCVFMFVLCFTSSAVPGMASRKDNIAFVHTLCNNVCNNCLTVCPIFVNYFILCVTSLSKFVCPSLFRQSLQCENDIYEWTRDHRAHHKFSETDADPHNAKRGFFFAHMGWLMCKKHPDVIAKGKAIGMDDLLEDPVIVFQRKYYLWMVAFMCFYFPAAVAHYGWGETWLNGFFVCAVFRYVAFLHCAWFVNSAAHLWGDRPYDKGISPAESMIAIISSSGEGFHNYHHTFPWDYQASEWGWKLNLCTFFIDLWHWMGIAYDLKKVSQDMVNRRRQMKGDGSKVWYPEVVEERSKAQ